MKIKQLQKVDDKDLAIDNLATFHFKIDYNVCNF